MPTPNVRYHFRQTIIPGNDAGSARVGLWILNPSNGRLRLCLLDQPEANKADFLKCSKWQGGSEVLGRYQMMDIRSRLPYSYRRLLPTTGKNLYGAWILNYETGAAQACLITNLDDPTGSLTCAATP